MAVTVLIDNYDSYTYNLYQMLSNFTKVIIIKNDQGDWLGMKKAILLDYGDIASIVLSPGPGHPSNEKDFGICRDVILYENIPLLGVCLGHQGLVLYHGGQVEHANEVMHGRLSKVRVVEEFDLFAYVPDEFDVVRYHSLVVSRPLPDGIQLMAQTEDGTVMAVKHGEKNMFGVQFHPESVCTEYGYQILSNFVNIAMGRACGVVKTKSYEVVGEPELEPLVQDEEENGEKYKVHVKKVDGVDTDRAFDAMYRSSKHSFWLDSSRTDGKNGRFSYMGDALGPLGKRIEYTVDTNTLVVYDSYGNKTCFQEHVSEYIQRQTYEYTMDEKVPFDFHGGYAGYFGYEAFQEQDALVNMDKIDFPAVPDVALLFTDQLVVFDHFEGEIYLVCLTLANAQPHEYQCWMKSMELLLSHAKPVQLNPMVHPHPTVNFTPSRSKACYLDNVEKALKEIYNGETYEVCLTNHLQCERTISDPLEFYYHLRKQNPAPFAGFFRYDSAGKHDYEFGGNEKNMQDYSFAVCCSSPERFIKMDQEGWIESKPIKGTRPRGENAAEDECIAKELESSVKDRAENLMIVDLVRNDLGRVCEIGSVHVPALMKVESYQTVHQLVSTIRGKCQHDKDIIDVLRSTFPGGSMTGAPKIRTMEILQKLEHHRRGIYSGALGFISINGAADLNIIIRTAIIADQKVCIGSGGAIVHMSTPNEEYEEMLLKTKALTTCISKYTNNVK